MASKKKKPSHPQYSSRVPTSILAPRSPNIQSSSSSLSIPPEPSQQDTSLATPDQQAGENTLPVSQIVEVWLNQSKAPPKVQAAWKKITTQLASHIATPSTTGQEIQKVLQRLDRIEKNMQTPASNLSYAQAVQKATVQEIPVPQRIFSEITIRPGVQIAQTGNRTPSQLVQAIKNKVPTSCQKDIRAVRKLPSGDIIISLESPSAKTQLEQNKDWISAVFSEEAKISSRIFPVMVHGVQIKDFNPDNLEETTKTIFRQNPGMENQVKILRTYWTRKSKLLKKSVTSLHIDLATPEQANLLIKRGVVLGHMIHEVEPALLDTSVVQYYKCSKFGHQARTCQAQAQCLACGGKHARRDCPIPQEKLVPKCANCGGKHSAWEKACPKKQEATQKARESWLTRPGRYTTPENISSTFIFSPSQTTNTGSGPNLSDREDGKKRKQGELVRTRSSARLSSQATSLQNLKTTTNLPKQNSFEILVDSNPEV